MIQMKDSVVCLSDCIAQFLQAILYVYGHSLTLMQLEPIFVPSPQPWWLCGRVSVFLLCCRWVAAPCLPCFKSYQWLAMCCCSGCHTRSLMLLGGAWTGWSLWSAASVSVWQHVNWSEQISPWYTLHVAWMACSQERTPCILQKHKTVTSDFTSPLYFNSDL